MSGGKAFFEVNTGGDRISQTGIGKLQFLDFEHPAISFHVFGFINPFDDVVDIIVDVVSVVHGKKLIVFGGRRRCKVFYGAPDWRLYAIFGVIVHGQIKEDAAMFSEIIAGL